MWIKRTSNESLWKSPNPHTIGKALHYKLNNASVYVFRSDMGLEAVFSGVTSPKGNKMALIDFPGWEKHVIEELRKLVA